MARKQQLEESLVISTRIEVNTYRVLQELAALESLSSGKTVSVQELIRNAINYVYTDNEKLRECFRRSRRVARAIDKKRLEKKECDV